MIARDSSEHKNREGRALLEVTRTFFVRPTLRYVLVNLFGGTEQQRGRFNFNRQGRFMNSSECKRQEVGRVNQRCIGSTLHLLAVITCMLTGGCGLCEWAKNGFKVGPNYVPRRRR